jgi:hypothetical protein
VTSVFSAKRRPSQTDDVGKGCIGFEPHKYMNAIAHAADIKSKTIIQSDNPSYIGVEPLFDVFVD